MRELKHSTSEGKRVADMGLRCKYNNITEVYNKVGKTNLIAYENCRKKFAEDDNAYNFRVGNGTSYSFTVSWFTVINDEEVMVVITRDNNYLVWLER